MKNPILPLLRAFNLDAIVGLDYETYWADDYTLSKMATTEYVTDPRFKTHMVSVQWHTDSRAKVLNPAEFKRFCKEVNWKRTGMLAHHTHFDGLILSHHDKVKPAFYLDTLSMARPVMPIQVGGSLNSACKAFGLKGKVGGDILVDTKGKRDLTVAEFKAMAKYAGNDIEQTWLLLKKLLPYIPIDELRTIDLTVKMYAQPTLLIDKEAIDRVLAADIARKESLIKELKVTKGQLTSKAKFADLLRAAGVEPPTKVSEKQSEAAGCDIEVFAMSKQDQIFKDLLGHPKKRVRKLVEARFAVASSIMETRCKRLSARAPLGPQPVYLNYCGAGTGRWSGGDEANWQNLSSKRKEGGAEMRASVHAPPGHKLVIADLGQIEARVNNWFCGQADMVEAFRARDAGEGPDVYKYVGATVIYNKPVDQITEDERFISKTCELALQYQAGWSRFAGMLRIGALGPPVDITDSLARDIHTAWRAGRSQIVKNWNETKNLFVSAFMGKQLLQHNVVSYQGVDEKAWMFRPSGMAQRYDGVIIDTEGGLSYISKYRRNKIAEPTIKRTRLYGGILVQNRTEGLARDIIAEHMREIVHEGRGKIRIAMSTHDELVGVVPDAYAERALKIFKAVMTTPPSWAKGLPLAVDAHISARYDK